MNSHVLEWTLKIKTVEYLTDFDIPLLRRDIDKPENVRWLLRNLAIRNGSNPNFNLVMTLLNILSEGYKK